MGTKASSTQVDEQESSICQHIPLTCPRLTSTRSIRAFGAVWGGAMFQFQSFVKLRAYSAPTARFPWPACKKLQRPWAEKSQHANRKPLPVVGRGFPTGERAGLALNRSYVGHYWLGSSVIAFAQGALIVKSLHI